MRTGPWLSPMMRTPDPMIVRGPTCTSPVISAVSNTVAVGSMVGVVPRYS